MSSETEVSIFLKQCPPFNNVSPIFNKWLKVKTFELLKIKCNGLFTKRETANLLKAFEFVSVQLNFCTNSHLNFDKILFMHKRDKIIAKLQTEREARIFHRRYIVIINKFWKSAKLNYQSNKLLYVCAWSFVCASSAVHELQICCTCLGCPLHSFSLSIPTSKTRNMKTTIVCTPDDDFAVAWETLETGDWTPYAWRKCFSLWAWNETEPKILCIKNEIALDTTTENTIIHVWYKLFTLYEHICFSDATKFFNCHRK